jgi:hypothetical protein
MLVLPEDGEIIMSKNNKSIVAAILCSVLVLSACGYMQPERGASPDIYIADSGNIGYSPVVRGQPDNTVAVLANIKTDAYTAKLSIGNKSFQASKSRSRGNVPLWLIKLDACRDIMQGKNIIMTLSQYDIDGKLILSQEAILPTVNAC